MRCSSFVFVLLAMFNISAQAAEKLIWRTETEFAQEIGPLGECKEDDDECIGADHVGYISVSHFGRTVYVTYEEASRVYISFDASLDADRDAQFGFVMGQLAPGAYDWGGVMEGGQFKPLYVIKRIYDPGFDYSTDAVDTSKSGLMVWRLSAAPGNGRSEKDFVLRQKEN
jgi:hypothetical protein